LSANRKHHHLELHNGPAAPLCLLRSPLIQAAQIMKLEVLPTSSPLRCRGHGRAAIRVLVMGKSASCGPVDPVWQLLASGRELQPGCPYPGQTVLMNVKLSNRTRFRYVMLQSTTFGGAWCFQQACANWWLRQSSHANASQSFKSARSIPYISSALTKYGECESWMTAKGSVLEKGSGEGLPSPH